MYLIFDKCTVCVSMACWPADRLQVSDDVIIVMFNTIHQQCRLEL